MMQSKNIEYNVIDQLIKDLVFGYTRIYCKNLSLQQIPNEINHISLLYFYEHDRFDKTLVN